MLKGHLMFAATTSSFAFDADMGEKSSIDMNIEIDQAFNEEETMAESISELTTEPVSEADALEALEEIEESYVGASNERLPNSTKRAPNSVSEALEVKI